MGLWVGPGCGRIPLPFNFKFLRMGGLHFLITKTAYLILVKESILGCLSSENRVVIILLPPFITFDSGSLFFFRIESIDFCIEF